MSTILKPKPPSVCTWAKTPSSTLHDHIDTSAFISDGSRGVSLGRASEQLLAVREAFAADNVEEEFGKEKAELEAQKITTDTSIAMPGGLCACA